MIYLIGGPPRCGKTMVSRRLAERLSCSRLPVDYLTTAFMGYVSSADEVRLFPREGARGDARFARFSAEQIVGNYSAIIAGEAQRYGLPLVDMGYPFFERIEAAVNVLCNPA